MDFFEDVVQAMGVESSLYVRLSLRAPWGISFDSGYQARLVVVVQGECWMTADGQEPARLAAGDALILKVGCTFALQDQLGRPLVTCEAVAAGASEAIVSYGGQGAVFEMISARLSFDPSAAEPLLAVLPNLLHVHLGDAHAERLRSTLQMIGLEAAAGDLGATFIISRLTDVLFVQTIRAWVAADGGSTLSWLSALKHRRLAVAVRAMHQDLARAWTIAELARMAGMSRSSFAALFKSVTGQAPLAYLTTWRIYRVKVLLRENLGLSQIAAEVGYDSDTALNRAFKRLQGCAPGVWRRGVRAS